MLHFEGLLTHPLRSVRALYAHHTGSFLTELPEKQLSKSTDILYVLQRTPVFSTPWISPSWRRNLLVDRPVKPALTHGRDGSGFMRHKSKNNIRTDAAKENVKRRYLVSTARGTVFLLGKSKTKQRTWYCPTVWERSWRSWVQVLWDEGFVVADFNATEQFSQRRNQKEIRLVWNEQQQSVRSVAKYVKHLNGIDIGVLEKTCAQKVSALMQEHDNQGLDCIIGENPKVCHETCVRFVSARLKIKKKLPR